MSEDTIFENWFENYFCNTQTQDSPYSYNDVKIAFFVGWRKSKEEHKEKVIDIIQKKIKEHENCGDIRVNPIRHCLAYHTLVNLKKDLFCDEK